MAVLQIKKRGRGRGGSQSGDSQYPGGIVVGRVRVLGKESEPRCPGRADIQREISYLGSYVSERTICAKMRETLQREITAMSATTWH